MVKRHQRPIAGRPNAAGRRDREGGPDPRLQRGDRGPQGQQADARRRDAATSRAPHARHQALRQRSSTDMARLKDRYNDEIRAALVSKFGYSTPMQAPRLVKVTLNMGVGEAKQDSKMLEAAQEQLADDRRPEAEHPPRPQVRRGVQAARGHAGRPDRHAARRARLRVPRPPDLDRDPAHARLPRPEPALVRRPRQLLHGRPRADHLPGDRLRHRRPGPRARRHHHHHRADRRRGVRPARRARHAVRARRAPGAASRASTGEPVAA